jgi:Protein of unknown function (DUF3306)
MAIDPKEPDEGFLGRWSRRKTEAREAPPVAAEQPRPVADLQEAPPELPSLDKLTFDSDFKGFFHPKVDENMRRAALRKLFSDPHFNVMDGLDVYIDDYSKSEPIPAAMLAGLKQAQRIINWANDKDDAGESSERLEADADNTNLPALAATPATENTRPPIEPVSAIVPLDKPEAGS